MSKTYTLEGRAQGKTASLEAAAAADCTEKLGNFLEKNYFFNRYPSFIFLSVFNHYFLLFSL